MTPSAQRTLTLLLLISGILLATFFGLRTLHAFKHFRGHRPPPPSASEAKQPETNVELIREWMTIPFISKTYHVPPPVLFDALGIPQNGNSEKSLAQLNKEYFPEEDGKVIETIKTVIREYQLQQFPIAPHTPRPSVQPIESITP